VSLDFRFAFPALSLPSELSLAKPPNLLSELFTEETCNALASAYIAWKQDNPMQSGYFSADMGAQVNIYELCMYIHVFNRVARFFLVRVTKTRLKYQMNTICAKWS
jgi:hypothetical protein